MDTGWLAFLVDKDWPLGLWVPLGCMGLKSLWDTGLLGHLCLHLWHTDCSWTYTGGVHPAAGGRWGLEGMDDWDLRHIAYGYRRSIGNRDSKEDRHGWWAFVDRELGGKAGWLGDHGPGLDRRGTSPSLQSVGRA